MNYEEKHSVSDSNEQSSGGLSSSLFKVLNDGEFDGNVCYVDRNTTDVNNNVNDFIPISEQASEGGRRKYIWDDFQEDQDMLRSDLTSDITSIESPLFDETEMKEGDHKESKFKRKIKEMKHEHDLKAGQVNQLKTALARKKVATERKLKLIKDEWDKRFIDQKQQNDVKEQELTELISRTNSDIDIYKHRRETLSHELQNVEATRRAMYVKLEKKGKEELLKLQQKWKRDECKRLSSIAKLKAVDLKKQAAQALEPEIRKIVQEYKDELRRKREEIELDLKTAKEELKVKNSERFAKMKREMDAEERNVMKNIDEDHERKSKEIKIEHERKIEETHKRVADELQSIEESHKALMQEREAIFKEKIEHQQNVNSNQIREVELAFEIEISELQKKGNEEENIALENQHVEINQWKLKRLPLLETEFMNLAIDKGKELELKANNEIKMVKEKLQIEFETKRKALLNDNEATVGSMKRSLEQEIEIELQRGNTLEIECGTMMKEKESVMVVLNRLKSRLNDVNKRYDELENKLKAETKRLAESESNYRDEELIEERNEKTELFKKKQQVKSLQQEVRTLEEKVKERQLENERVINALTEANEKELLVADTKIKSILDRKKDEMIGKDKILTCLQGKFEELDLQLSTARKQQIFNESSQE